jgi:hypothetical protein
MKAPAPIVRTLLAFAALSAAGANLEHAQWDAVLKEYVTTGSRVDYRRLKEQGLRELDGYLRQLASPWPDGMPASARKAALINAYNALTVRWILSNYPVRSIWSTEDPFRAQRHVLDGKPVSLDEIENRLRAMGDPRIHGALVCAARSCPPLRREAYVADRINEQLDGNLRLWFADARMNEFFADGRPARISAIFKWYGADFEQAGGVKNFLARYAPPEAREALTVSGRPIEYKRYDWGLNDTSAGAGYSQLDFYMDWIGNGYLAGAVTDWFLNLGRKHGVNPLVFGAIYVGAIPFFSVSVAWLIRNIRRRRSVAGPALCASFCFVSAYLYLFVAGKNLPAWVYFFLLGMLALGGYSAIRKIKVKLSDGGHA